MWKAAWVCVVSPSVHVLWAVSCGRGSVVSSVCSSLPSLPPLVHHIVLCCKCWEIILFINFFKSAVFHQAAVGPWISRNMVHGGWSPEVILSCQQCKIMKMGRSHTAGRYGATCLREQLCANCFCFSSATASTMGRSGVWKVQVLLSARAQDSGTKHFF